MQGLRAATGLAPLGGLGYVEGMKTWGTAIFVTSALGLAVSLFACGGHPVPPPLASAKACQDGNVSTCSSECDAGNAQSCYRLAAAAEVGQDGTDSRRAESLYKKACDAGYPQACARLGLAYKNGDFGSEDEPRAKPLLEKGCAGGVAIACGALAPVPTSTETVPPPPPPKPLPTSAPAAPPK